MVALGLGCAVSPSSAFARKHYFCPDLPKGCQVTQHDRPLAAGGRVDTDTRLWDEAGGCTVAMRTKEDSEDYRYFPEPDLPPLALAPDRLARLRASLPELPDARQARLASGYGLGEDDAGAMARTEATSVYFEQTAQASGDAAATCRWMRGELSRHLAEAGLAIESSNVTLQASGALMRTFPPPAFRPAASAGCAVAGLRPGLGHPHVILGAFSTSLSFGAVTDASPGCRD